MGNRPVVPVLVALVNHLVKEPVTIPEVQLSVPLEEVEVPSVKALAPLRMFPEVIVIVVLIVSGVDSVTSPEVRFKVK